MRNLALLAAGILIGMVLLNDAIITDWRIGGSNDVAPSEQVQVAFGKFSFTDVPSGNKFCYDPEVGKTC